MIRGEGERERELLVFLILELLHKMDYCSSEAEQFRDSEYTYIQQNPVIKLCPVGSAMIGLHILNASAMESSTLHVEK